MEGLQILPSYQLLIMERTYKVTYACDSLDPNPTIKTFDCFNEMEDWINEEVEGRVQFQVDHSSYSIDEKERESIEEQERALVRIEEVV